MGIRGSMRGRIRWAAIGLLAALLVGSGQMPSVRADINGDGTDEVGAFAVEVTGLARGPWYQVWESDGTLVASQFLNPAFSQYQLQTMDVDGNGSEELVIFSVRNSDGAGRIEVRLSGGAVLAQAFVTGAPFSRHQLFPINYNGGAASEIGLGFDRTSDGVGFYKVLRVTGGTIVEDSGAAISGPLFSSREWRAGDFDGDGNQEVFLGFRRTSDGAAAYTVWDPQTNTTTGAAFVTGSAFSGHEWVVGNFDNSQAGDEILIGFNQVSNGAGVFQVRRVNGALVGGRFISGAGFSEFEWAGISDGTDQQVFVGYIRNSDGASAYAVWDATVGGGTQVGSAFALSGAFQLVEWLTGNFDGNAGNGGEVALGFVQDSNGSIGYAQWTRAGSQNSSRFVLGGTFFNPTFVGLQPATSARDDLLIGATGSTGQPIVQLWDTNGAGTQVLSQAIFNTDVV